MQYRVVECTFGVDGLEGVHSVFRSESSDECWNYIKERIEAAVAAKNKWAYHEATGLVVFAYQNDEASEYSFDSENHVPIPAFMKSTYCQSTPEWARVKLYAF